MWLQGFDEPMKLNDRSGEYSSINRFSDDESLLSDFHKLNRKGREAAQAAVKGMTCLPEYTEAEGEDVG